MPSDNSDNLPPLSPPRTPPATLADAFGAPPPRIVVRRTLQLAQWTGPCVRASGPCSCPACVTALALRFRIALAGAAPPEPEPAEQCTIASAGVCGCRLCQFVTLESVGAEPAISALFAPTSAESN